MTPLALSVRVERWPIAGSFAISRGAKTEAVVVVAELSDGSHRGRGECVPYARYGETVEGVAAAIEAMAADISRGLDRERLQSAMEPGAVRNALDCAFWDLAAKRAARPVHELLGLDPPKPVTTALTISLATPEAMAQAAAAAAERALLKIKLGAAGDAARIAAVRRAAPRAELIVDANEGWTPDDLAANLAACAQAGVTLVEQPLPAPNDDALARIARARDLRRRERARTRLAARARGQVRRRQHQARQDRRPDRGARHGRRSRAARIYAHGRLHGRDLAGAGAGDACCPARARRRPRRGAAARARPAARPSLRGQ